MPNMYCNTCQKEQWHNDITQTQSKYYDVYKCSKCGKCKKYK